MEISPQLVQKYDSSLPRYTSYPTAPAWKQTWTTETYWKALQEIDAQNLSVYVHVPFCERMCYFCGCNMVVSRDVSTGSRYVDVLLDELNQVSAQLPPSRSARQFHIGGGTPTFLLPQDLDRLITAFRRAIPWSDDAEISIEVDPRVTTDDHLAVLKTHGFNRISMGVQDTDDQVQAAINRDQSAAVSQRMISKARELGIPSINVDLIYGLPEQTPTTFQSTLNYVNQWQVDRLAVYSFAYLPKLRPLQVMMPTEAIPTGETKLKLLLMAIDQLPKGGYRYIGMDHFALPSDELVRAQDNRTLQRNFMGYTTWGGTQLLGFGVSAIGHFGRYFVQNERSVQTYQQRIKEHGSAVFRGFTMSSDDLIREWVIQQLTCNLSVRFDEFQNRFKVRFQDYFAHELPRLSSLLDDDLVTLEANAIALTSNGHVLMRPVAAIFDAYLTQIQAASPAVFSRSV